MRRMLVWCAAATIGAATPAGAATVDELAQRIERLEQRVRQLEEQLLEKDREIAELKGRAAQRPLPPPGNLDRNLDQMQDLIDRMRRQFQGPGNQWNLPGMPPAPQGPQNTFPWARPRGKGGYLGVQIGPAVGGAAIESVLPGSAAALAGLLSGDVIVCIDNRDVRQPGDVVSAVGEHEPGEQIRVTVLRNGAEQTFTVTLGRREDGPTFDVPQLPQLPGFPRSLNPLQGNLPGGDRDGEMKLTVKTPAGEATLSMSMPGLNLTDDMAKRLELTDDERVAVELACSSARDDLARRLAEKLRTIETTVVTAEVVRMRREAERDARRRLAAQLPERKLAELERIQEELAARSTVSFSIRGRGGATSLAPHEPRVIDDDEPAEF